MLVTWVVKSGSVHDTPTVEYGPSEGSLHLKATAEETHFKEDKTEFRTFRALMTGLTAGGSTVYYRVGSSGTAWSKTFHFRTLSRSSSSSSWLPRLAIYGDLGYTNAQSTPYLVKEVAAGHFDALFHIGDFAYDLHSVSVPSELFENFLFYQMITGFLNHKNKTERRRTRPRIHGDDRADRRSGPVYDHSGQPRGAR